MTMLMIATCNDTCDPGLKRDESSSSSCDALLVDLDLLALSRSQSGAVFITI